jgi:hypothetical protein
VETNERTEDEGSGGDSERRFPEFSSSSLFFFFDLPIIPFPFIVFFTLFHHFPLLPLDMVILITVKRHHRLFFDRHDFIVFTVVFFFFYIRVLVE